MTRRLLLAATAGLLLAAAPPGALAPGDKDRLQGA
jgi:hypothetical protein